jgi:hypothetical protein
MRPSNGNSSFPTRPIAAVVCAAAAGQAELLSQPLVRLTRTSLGLRWSRIGADRRHLLRRWTTIGEALLSGLPFARWNRGAEISMETSLAESSSDLISAARAPAIVNGNASAAT